MKKKKKIEKAAESVNLGKENKINDDFTTINFT